MVCVSVQIATNLFNWKLLFVFLCVFLFVFVIVCCHCVCHDILIIVSSKKVKPMVCVWVQIAPNLFNWKSSNCRIRTSSVIGEILSPRYPNGVSDHHHRWHYHYNAHNFNNTRGSHKVWILSQSGAGGALTESQVFIKKGKKTETLNHSMQ